MILTSSLLREIKQAIIDAGVIADGCVFIEDVNDPNWESEEQLNIYEMEREPIGHQLAVCGYKCTVILKTIASTKERTTEIIKQCCQIVENINLNCAILISEEITKASSGSKIENAFTGERQYTIYTQGE